MVDNFFDLFIFSSQLRFNVIVYTVVNYLSFAQMIDELKHTKYLFDLILHKWKFDFFQKKSEFAHQRSNMAGNDREMISKNFVNIPDTLQQRLLLTTIAKIAKMTRFESSNQKPEIYFFFSRTKTIVSTENKGIHAPHTLITLPYLMWNNWHIGVNPLPALTSYCHGGFRNSLICLRIVRVDSVTLTGIRLKWLPCYSF